MIKFNEKEQGIINIFFQEGEMRSSEVHKELVKTDEDISLITIKRALSNLTQKKALKKKGAGRSTSYVLTIEGRVFSDVDSQKYTSIEPDKRYGFKSFNFDLFDNFPKSIFSEIETKELEELTSKHKKKSKEITETIQKKELERLTIELSWKSSKIEGNTYSLLDTEKLIKDNQPAERKTREETQMILNHKDAFSFIYQNKKLFKDLDKNNLINLHKILVKDLNVNAGFRKSLVGISGSRYQPLNNIYQIEEAINSLSDLISDTKNPFSKSLIALLGISYIQPFEDGNKRTSRLMANALLLANNCAPLSYRSINEKEYKSATLVFYELNSIIPFKEIFINQYKFAVENYNIK